MIRKRELTDLLRLLRAEGVDVRPDGRSSRHLRLRVHAGDRSQCYPVPGSLTHTRNHANTVAALRRIHRQLMSHEETP